MPAPYTTTQIMMTLAAISYATPTTTIPKLLANTDYATNGDWSLAWGPVTAELPFDNMAFVAQQTGTGTYAVVLRGTVFDSLLSWFEDIPEHVISFSAYTKRAPGLVSSGFFDGLSSIMDATSDGQTMIEFLKAQSPETLYVTGHSQGAALSPMALAWLLTELDMPAMTSGAFAFAQPSPGDQNFAMWIDRFTQTTVVNNTRDVVPYAYGRLKDVVQQGIPTEPNAIETGLIRAMCGHAAKVMFRGDPKSVWTTAGAVTQIQSKTHHRSHDSFLKQVEYEHDHNTYLSLLGAPSVTL